MCLYVWVYTCMYIHVVFPFPFQAMEMDGGKLSSHGALPVSSGWVERNREAS